MKITMKRILSTIMATVIFASCVPTPDNVKNSEAEKDKTESANEFVAADDLYCDADMIKQYIKDKGYTKQLIFNGTTVIDKVDKLYELDIETLTDAHQKFPELYNTLFNSDFYRDSNVNNINKLPKYSENADAKYVFDDFTSIGDGVIYNNENPDKQTSQYLNVSTGGFVYYENYRYSQGKNYQSIYRVVDNNVEGKEYKMTDGSLYKLKDAVEYSNKFINKSFKPLGSEYVYRVGRIAPMIMQNDSGAYNYYLDIEKTYKGVPFCNQIIADYEKVRAEQVKREDAEYSAYLKDFVENHDNRKLNEKHQKQIDEIKLKRNDLNKVYNDYKDVSRKPEEGEKAKEIPISGKKISKRAVFLARVENKRQA